MQRLIRTLRAILYGDGPVGENAEILQRMICCPFAMSSIPVVRCMYANLWYRQSTLFTFPLLQWPQQATVATCLRRASLSISGLSATRKALGSELVDELVVVATSRKKKGNGVGGPPLQYSKRARYLLTEDTSNSSNTCSKWCYDNRLLPAYMQQDYHCERVIWTQPNHTLSGILAVMPA